MILKNVFVAYTKRLLTCSLLLISISVTAIENLPTLPAKDLIESLKSGGYIIYMRHGATDITQKDQTREGFDDCEKQRNLSEEGRQKIQSIGAIIQQLEIPIGHVSSRPYCRTKDTAALAFGEYDIDQNLQFSISKNKAEAQQLGSYLLSKMMASNPTDKNEVFVGHTANLKDGLGIWPKPEGVLVVFKKEEGEVVFKGMIKPEEWPFDELL